MLVTMWHIVVCLTGQSQAQPDQYAAEIARKDAAGNICTSIELTSSRHWMLIRVSLLKLQLTGMGGLVQSKPPLIPWTAWCNTWLLFKVTLKGVVFSFFTSQELHVADPD